jgi:hypothetical protein
VLLQAYARDKALVCFLHCVRASAVSIDAFSIVAAQLVREVVLGTVSSSSSSSSSSSAQSRALDAPMWSAVLADAQCSTAMAACSVVTAEQLDATTPTAVT